MNQEQKVKMFADAIENLQRAIRELDYDRAAVERAQRQIENLEEFKRQAEQRCEMEQVKGQAQ